MNDVLHGYREQINRKNLTPLYSQLEKVILKAINDGVLKEGDILPTELELEHYFQISRTTVRQAMSNLVLGGYLYKVQGKGTYVQKKKMKFDYMQESFNDQVKKNGLTPYSKVIFFEVETVNLDVAEIMKIPADSKVIRLKRIRYSGDEPIALTDAYLRYDKCSFILDYDFEYNSLFETLAKKEESRIVRVRRVLEAVAADENDSRLLKINKGFPMQYFIEEAYSKDDVLIAYGTFKCRGDRNQSIVESKIWLVYICFLLPELKINQSLYNGG